jgi:hypothetical protein
MNTLNFLDANVWQTLLWSRHIHSERARSWFEQAGQEQFLFGRFTQITVLRLLTTEGSTSHQTWLFYSPLARQATLLEDDLLDTVDQLLYDPALVDLVRQCLATRSPRSTRTGRDGIAPDRLLRCCVMKHLKGWGFRDLERELRSNLVYRRFTHFDAEATPDFTTFSRSFALLSPAVTEQIHQRVVGLACSLGPGATRPSGR